MRPTNYLPKPALLLSTLTALSLYANPVFAQNDDDSSADSEPTSAPAAKSSANNDKSSAAPAKTTAAAAQSSSAKEDKPTSTAAKETPKSTSKAEPTSAAPESTEEDEPTSSEEKTSAAATTATPVQTTLNSIADDGALTGLPTLTKYKPIPTYPPPTIPPTNNAPFMQHSSAPQGTVFIAVGAILGAFMLAILIWRAIVGFLLHRSVERAAQAQHAENAKAGFPAPPAPFYKYSDHTSTMSLSAGRGVRRTNRGPIPSSNPSVSNLFFSPTAAATGGGVGSNRGSTFLPSGFYAAGNSAPGGHEHSISLTNLRPDSSRGPFANPSRNTLGPSPPDSPSFHARRDISSSSLNLNRPPSQRAPSAFLEDLLADDPSSLPPPHMPPSRHSAYSNTPSPLGSPTPLNRI